MICDDRKRGANNTKLKTKRFCLNGHSGKKKITLSVNTTWAVPPRNTDSMSWAVACNSDIAGTDQTRRNELEITGSGEVEVDPDTIRLVVSTRRRSTTENGARAAAASAIEPAVARAQLNGTFVVTDVSTAVYESMTAPEPGEARTVAFYIGETRATFESRDVGKAVGLIEDLLKGASIFSVDVYYELRDRTSAVQQASRLAVSRAYDIARSMAEAAGANITGVLRISTSSSRPRVYAERSARSAPSPSDTGSRKYSLLELGVVKQKIAVSAQAHIVFSISGDVAEQPPGLTKKATNTGLVRDIRRLTLENRYYRRVLETTNEQQLVVMFLAPGIDIERETHAALTQFVRVEEGAVETTIGTETGVVGDDEFVVIPAGVEHYFRQTGPVPAKLYLIYSSSAGRGAFEHEDKQIDIVRPRSDKKQNEASPAAARFARCDLFQ